jgi:hypothetical protein
MIESMVEYVHTYRHELHTHTDSHADNSAVFAKECPCNLLFAARQILNDPDVKEIELVRLPFDTNAKRF